MMNEGLRAQAKLKSRLDMMVITYNDYCSQLIKAELPIQYECDT